MTTQIVLFYFLLASAAAVAFIGIKAWIEGLPGISTYFVVAASNAMLAIAFRYATPTMNLIAVLVAVAVTTWSILGLRQSKRSTLIDRTITRSRTADGKEVTSISENHTY